MFKLEDSKQEDFIDKSLDLFLIFSQNLNRSYLSKQAFISLFQNDFFIEEVVAILNLYLENDPTEYEAHLTLIIEILTSVFTDYNKSTDITLLLYGPVFHDIFIKLHTKLQSSYDNLDMDPVNKEFTSKVEYIINFLACTKIFSDSKEINKLLSYINDCCFSNIQKYNLNEKPVNEDNIKEENTKEYVKGLKLNILNYLNSDADYLQTIKRKDSLINELFVAVKIVNLSVITLFNAIYTIYIIYIIYIILIKYIIKRYNTI